MPETGAGPRFLWLFQGEKESSYTTEGLRLSQHGSACPGDLL